MFKVFPTFALVALAALTSAPATIAAQPVSQSDDQPGFYLGGGAGRGDIRLPGATAPGNKNEGSGVGFKMYGGYQFNQYFATELQYTSLGNFLETSGTEKPAKNIRRYGFSLSAVGMAPVTDRLSALGKIGVMRALHRADKEVKGDYGRGQTGLLFGVGAEFKATERLILRAEFEKTAMKKPKNSLINPSDSLFTVGARYRF